jgi:4'-phosphopantetheinyl transferase
VLGSYLRIPSESITFVYGEKGKPALLSAQNSLDLRFNVSHSGSLGILAVTNGCELGVDIETRQSVVDYMAISKRFFAPREHETLSEVPEELRQRAFLRCWTRKESYIKALGQGLACSLKSFSVSVAPQLTDDCLIETASTLTHHVSDIDLRDQCFAALAVEGKRRRKCCWTYCDSICSFGL